MAARILHLADVHLDRPFVGSSLEIARERRRQLRQAFRRCLDLAAKREVDAITIGGDLWEREHVVPDTLRWVSAQLEGVGVPVVIVAGNHDPLEPGGAYDRAQFSDNVRVLAAGPQLDHVELGDVVIWGMSWGTNPLRADVLDQFRVPNDGRDHLLLLHGTSGAYFDGAGHCPFTERQVRSAGFRRCLSGHLHGASDEAAIVIYPGSPEPLAWSQDGRHAVAVLELDGQGGSEVTFADVNQRSVATVTVDCTGATSSADIERLATAAVTALDVREGLVARVRLEGRVEHGCGMDVVAVRQSILAHGVKQVEVTDQTQVAFDLREIELGGGVRAEFVRALGSELDSTGDPAQRRVLELARDLGLRALHGDQL